MAQKRHIGLVIFSICCALSARIAFFEPKPHIPTEAEKRWGVAQRESQTSVILRGMRYYIYGVGIVGLLVFVEDYVGDRKRRKKPNQSLEPTRMDDGSAN